jgi:hypothetical protein
MPLELSSKGTNNSGGVLSALKDRLVSALQRNATNNTGAGLPGGGDAAGSARRPAPPAYEAEARRALAFVDAYEAWYRDRHGARDCPACAAYRAAIAAVASDATADDWAKATEIREARLVLEAHARQVGLGHYGAASSGNSAVLPQAPSPPPPGSSATTITAAASRAGITARPPLPQWVAERLTRRSQRRPGREKIAAAAAAAPPPPGSSEKSSQPERRLEKARKSRLRSSLRNSIDQARRQVERASQRAQQVGVRCRSCSADLATLQQLYDRYVREGGAAVTNAELDLADKEVQEISARSEAELRRLDIEHLALRARRVQAAFSVHGMQDVLQTAQELERNIHEYLEALPAAAATARAPSQALERQALEQHVSYLEATADLLNQMNVRAARRQYKRRLINTVYGQGGGAAGRGNARAQHLEAPPAAAAAAAAPGWLARAYRPKPGQVLKMS